MIIMLKDAEGMYCPLGRTSNVDLHCDGDACMAWTWVEERWRRSFLCDEPEATAEPARPAHVPADWEWHPYDGEDGACWVQPLDEAMRDRKGYCGMVRRAG